MSNRKSCNLATVTAKYYQAKPYNVLINTIISINQNKLWQQ